MQLIDTHCHLDLPIFNDDRQTILRICKTSGITRIILPGVCQSGWDNLLKLCSTEESLYPAIGLHPMYLRHHTPQHLDKLADHISRTPLVALGEIGLDFYTEKINRKKQQELFEAQLQLAKKANLPLLLHVRKAYDQVLSILRKHHFPHGGIVHAFSGSLQQAQQYIDMGFKISFCGTVTYDRARKIRRLAVDLRLEDMVLETDSPDLPPAQHHGKRNNPENLIHVVNCLAELRQQPREVIAETTCENARNMLHL